MINVMTTKRDILKEKTFCDKKIIIKRIQKVRRKMKREILERPARKKAKSHIILFKTP